MTTITSNVSFDDTQSAFTAKNNRELIKTWWLFRIMSNPKLVRSLSKFTIWSLNKHIPLGWLIKPTIFKQFCGGESIEETRNVIQKLHSSHIGSILDYSVEGKESDSDFERTKNEVIKIILLAKNNPSIPYTSLKLTGIARFGLLEKLKEGKLSQAETQELAILKTRIHAICDTASRAGVPIYFDAEESWIQDAIDDLALEMMRKYNKNKAIVLTTLQMYRHDRLKYLSQLIKLSKEEGFYLGIKLVRGAYWEKENERADRMGYCSPVHQLKEHTDRDFNSALRLCLENIDRITLCAGTHNEESTMNLIELMKELKIQNDHSHVFFSQLYGMSDHISYNLAAAGYNVTKYLPYGPVNSVIPYLIRRAEENTSIAGQMGRELSLLNAEKKRRRTLKLLHS